MITEGFALLTPEAAANRATAPNYTNRKKRHTSEDTQSPPVPIGGREEEATR